MQFFLMYVAHQWAVFNHLKVTTGFTDSDIIVREAACVAIGQFADNLQPDIISRHAIVLPNLFQGLSDPSGDVCIINLLY